MAWRTGLWIERVQEIRGAEDRVREEVHPAVETWGFGDPEDEETRAILRDEETMKLLRAAEEDIKAGRLVDWDEMRTR